MAMKAGGDGELNSEINVTPMVDVMLVLLIIFMITAPMMNNNVTVQLPTSNFKDVDDPNGPLILEVHPDKLLFDKKTVASWNELSVLLTTNEKVKKDEALYVAGDPDMPYQRVLTAMSVARKANIKKVMLMTKDGDPTVDQPDQPKPAPAATH